MSRQSQHTHFEDKMLIGEDKPQVVQPWVRLTVRKMWFSIFMIRRPYESCATWYERWWYNAAKYGIVQICSIPIQLGAAVPL